MAKRKREDEKTPETPTLKLACETLAVGIKKHRRLLASMDMIRRLCNHGIHKDSKAVLFFVRVFCEISDKELSTEEIASSIELLKNEFLKSKPTEDSEIEEIINTFNSDKELSFFVKDST
jgi:hypothetical protein